MDMSPEQITERRSTGSTLKIKINTDMKDNT